MWNAVTRGCPLPSGTRSTPQNWCLYWQGIGALKGCINPISSGNRGHCRKETVIFQHANILMSFPAITWTLHGPFALLPPSEICFIQTAMNVVQRGMWGEEVWETSPWIPNKLKMGPPESLFRASSLFMHVSWKGCRKTYCIRTKLVSNLFTSSQYTLPQIISGYYSNTTQYLIHSDASSACIITKYGST